MKRSINRQFESRAVAIDELFAPPFIFRSPAFQRPFAWDFTDAERLFADLQSAGTERPDDVYFLGAILLVLAPGTMEALPTSAGASIWDGEEHVFEIIDGLQRIVTLSILLSAFRDLLGRDDRPRPGTLLLIEALRGALTTAATKTPRVALPGADGAYLSHCLGEAGACLVPPLATAVSMPQERLLGIRDFFVRQLRGMEADELSRFVEFVLRKCALVAITTNTIDRAFHMFTVLNDTGKPLTRNDILKAELIGAMAPADRGEATAQWDELAVRLDDDFEQLFSFVSTEAGRGSKAIVEAVRLEVAAHPTGAGGYVFDTLLPAGRIIDVMLHARHAGARQSAEINRLLRALSALPGREWVPPLLAFWKRHGTDAAALLVFITALERFAYGVRILALGAEKRAQRLAAMTALIAAGAPPHGPWPQLVFNRDELRNINHSLRDLHRRSPQICRLVLQRLEERQSGKPLAADVTFTVEHILPMNVGAASLWRTVIPDADNRKRLASCLGNLTLVTQVANEKAGNHDYARKCAVYFGPDGVPVTSLTAELRAIPAWTAAVIEARLVRMLAAINAMWRFDA